MLCFCVFVLFVFPLSFSPCTQVLSDTSLRAQYDERGLEGVDKRVLDHAALFQFIFGSDDFLELIGELQLASLVPQMQETGGKGEGINMDMLFGTDPATDTKQRRREVDIAVHLADRLASYVRGDDDAFAEEMQRLAEKLSKLAIGADLLAVIGRVYDEQAREVVAAFNGV